MVNSPFLMDPRMLGSLRDSGFFPQRLSVIDRVEVDQSPSGAPIYEMQVRPGHDQIPAALSYVNTGERMTQVQSITTADRRTLLSGYYPAIAIDDKIRDDSDLDIDEADREVWKITQIDHDTHEQLTRVYLDQADA